MRCALSLAPTEALPYPTISCACALAGPLLPCLVVAVQRYVVVLCMCCAERLTATKRCRGAAQTPTSSCTSTRARSTQRSSSSTRIRAAVKLGWRWRTQTCCSRGRPRERAASAEDPRRRGVWFGAAGQQKSSSTGTVPRESASRAEQPANRMCRRDRFALQTCSERMYVVAEETNRKHVLISFNVTRDRHAAI